MSTRRLQEIADLLEEMAEEYWDRHCLAVGKSKESFGPSPWRGHIARIQRILEAHDAAKAKPGRAQ
jgi:hypothetical protein